MDRYEADLTSVRAAVDQLCRLREETAREVAAYHRALRREGVPRRLAASMVRDWHNYRAWQQEAEED